MTAVATLPNSSQTSSPEYDNVDRDAPLPAEPPLFSHDVLKDFETYIRTNQASERLIAFLRQHVRERDDQRESTRMMLIKDDQRRLAFWLGLRGKVADDLALLSEQGAMPKDQTLACLKLLTRTNARIRRSLDAT
jgi:hypothetical protein